MQKLLIREAAQRTLRQADTDGGEALSHRTKRAER